ncbi:asparaginase [Hamadaea sp. NPDC051192]|uniref:asparaginase n=1 Tax=Hamadaea sp. NPDC051192 TaxID=3154940 RepID=UPI00342F6B34
MSQALTEVPAVAVIGVGGTIAMVPTSAGGVSPQLTATDLVQAVPGLAEHRLSVVDFRRVPGAWLSFADLDELLTAIDEAMSAGAAGVVVTTGTDSIEEMAYYLDLRHTRPEPVVVTGAMRNPATAGADGPANLLAAVVTAADPAARDRGVLVVLQDEIHLAARVQKTHTTSPSAFASPNAGPAGRLVEGTPRWLTGPVIRRSVPTAYPGSAATAPRVLLHTVTLDDDPAFLADAESRMDGLIVAGMGVGHVPAVLVEPLTKAAAAIPVVLASRIGRGPVLTWAYGFPGSERDLIGRGLIPAGFLDPLKARVLLRTLLASGASREQIRQVFTDDIS